MPLPYRRQDGSYVIAGPLGPYHVTADDPLYADVAAELDGQALDAEPLPEPLPAAPPMVTTLAFMERFTSQERIAIRAAARAPGGEAIDDWLDLLRAAQWVVLDDARTLAGIAALVSAGLLSAERAAEVLA